MDRVVDALSVLMLTEHAVDPAVALGLLGALSVAMGVRITVRLFARASREGASLPGREPDAGEA